MEADTFRNITGFKPYPHQLEVVESLNESKSVILRAPTGSGKSEAVLVPFYIKRKMEFPKQMIYSLPLRTLVDSIAERFLSYSENRNLNLRVSGYHGKRLETPLFYADAIVTTIDQTVGAYTCTPLSLPIRHGNIPAGAVSTAFLVFDEVHTFEPLLGLQASLILAEHSSKLGIPFVFMSATMPDSFIGEIQSRFNMVFIDADEEDIQARRRREVIVHLKNEVLDANKVTSLYSSYQGKVIVVCNTVQKAQSLYESIKGRIDCEVILLHSRFLDEDRAKKEKRIKELFTTKSNDKGILIATQVIEVGLDISCDTMLTELAPIDSLIQRAGRCARKGGKGELYIFDVESSAPYEREMLETTKKVLTERNTERLDWEEEKRLVNEILGERFQRYLNPENGAKILNKLAKGAFLGKRKLVEETVRDIPSCEVTIHHDPADLGYNVFRLKRINVHVGILSKILKGINPKIWSVQMNDRLDEYLIKVREVKSASEIMPYGFYVVHPEFATYSPELGLLFGEAGKSLNFIEAKDKTALESRKREESWYEHARETLNVLRQLLPYYESPLRKFASAWNLKYGELTRRVEITAVLHDLGKLNKEWQRRIRAKGRNLAHSKENSNITLPPHATISAYALSDFMFENFGEFGYILQFVIQHHHNVRAREVPSYKLVHNWMEEVENVLNLIEVDLKLDTIIVAQRSSTSLDRFPDSKKAKLYRTYCLISRILRLADRIATIGDPNAILKYEEWYGG